MGLEIDQGKRGEREGSEKSKEREERLMIDEGACRENVYREMRWKREKVERKETRGEREREKGREAGTERLRDSEKRREIQKETGTGRERDIKLREE